MDTFGIILLGVLCCIIAAGFLFRQQRVVRLVVVFILFCISFGSVMSLSTFGPRLAVSQHERQGGSLPRTSLRVSPQPRRFQVCTTLTFCYPQSDLL